METLNIFLGKWEPLWLIAILSLEATVGIATFVILIIEYWYDKEFNENIKASRKERRRKQYEFENLTEGESR